MAQKVAFLYSLMLYSNIKTVNTLHKLIVYTLKVDKTFFHINLKVLNHITWFCHPRARIIQNKHQRSCRITYEHTCNYVFISFSRTQFFHHFGKFTIPTLKTSRFSRNSSNTWLRNISKVLALSSSFKVLVK